MRDYEKADIPLVHDDCDLVCCDCFCIMSCNQIGWKSCLEGESKRKGFASSDEYLNAKFSEYSEEWDEFE